MKEQIRETIKSNLQKLSKEELIDTLADIFMTLSAISMTDTLSNTQHIKQSQILKAINQQSVKI